MEKLRHPGGCGSHLRRYNFRGYVVFDKYLLSYVLKCFVGEYYVFYCKV